LLDTNYASAGGISSGNNERVEDMARQADGKVIIVGNFTSVHGTTRNRIARLNEDGSLDAEFNPGSGADGIIRTLVLQPDGRIILGGEFTSFDGTAREYLVRLLANGGVDTSFVGPDFFGTSGWRVLTLALQSDGRILVGGSFVLPAGAVARAGVCRLTSSGAMDPSFNGINEGAHQEGSPSTILAVRHMALQLDGSILIAGDFTAYNNNPRSRLARLTSSGTLDVGFTPSADDICFSLLVQPDDKILIGGNFTTLNGVPAARYGRLLKSGALDPDFNVAGLNTFVNDFALQPDGRLVFGSNVGQSGIGGTSNSIWRVFAGLSELPGTIQWSTVVTNANEGSAATLTVTRVGGAAGALEVNFATVPGTAGANDFTSVSGTLRWANGETASKTVQILTASDPEIEGTESVFVNLGQPLVGAAMLGNIQQIRLNITEAVSGFASWQAANFTPAELANPAISGDSADPDLDGINNLLEYAFGLPPKLPSTTGVPTGAISSVGGVNYLTLTFRRRMPLADLTYTPQTGGAVTGTWNADAVIVGSPVSNGDGTETVTYRDSVPQPSNAQRFMRVQVQRTP
jgi:uncharacterized delta-60 repeat protein